MPDLKRTPTARDLPPLFRRWLAVLAVLVVSTFALAVLLAVGLYQLRQDTLTNRELGHGNRVVTCTSVALADRATAAKLPECAGVALP